MRDVAKYLTSKQASSSPDMAAQWAKLESMYNKKLWHQLTVELFDFVRQPGVQDELVQLYENFIADFENKINLLSLTELCAAVVSRMSSTEVRLAFLDQLLEKIKANREATALCRTLIGNIKLHEQGDRTAAKTIIEEVEQILAETDGVTPVHGRFYLLCSDFYRIAGRHADFYRASLRFLGCTDLETLSADERRGRAFALGVAALLGEGVYNLGELLAHPVLESLQGQDEQWLVELLFVMNSGDIAGFHRLKSRWAGQPDLVAKEKFILQKITLLALMEMTFKRPATDRNLSFAEIAETTGVRAEEVELLVMKALAQGLLKGTIDQVDSVVHFTWVQPRVLDKKQLSTMMLRLENWSKDISKMESLVETKAHDILTM